MLNCPSLNTTYLQRRPEHIGRQYNRTEMTVYSFHLEAHVS